MVRIVEQPRIDSDLPQNHGRVMTQALKNSRHRANRPDAHRGEFLPRERAGSARNRQSRVLVLPQAFRGHAFQMIKSMSKEVNYEDVLTGTIPSTFRPRQY